MELDLDASLQRLAESLAGAWRAGWTPTPERLELVDLAQTLDRAVEALDAVVIALGEPYQWSELEDAVDGGHPGRFGCAAVDAAELVDLLRDIAHCARALADALPDPRVRPALGYAADVFLHLWREAGRDRPTLSEAVLAFGRVLDAAGIYRCPDTARKLLAEAFDRYDPHCQTPDWRESAVWRA